MKVLVLNPPYGEDFCRSARWAARSRGRVQRHPDWLLIAVAVLERGGNSVLFIDGAAQNLSIPEIEKRAREFRPDLAVIHTTTPSIDNDLFFAREIKRHAGMVVVIGPHVTAVPEDTFQRASFLDAIVLGEYDDTLLEITSGKSLEQIPGLALLRGDRIERTGARPPVDVAALPFPAWRHIRPEWYRDGGKRFPFLTLISGRGCPNYCTFCRDTPLLYGHTLRLRSPEQVVDEMEEDRRQFPQIREIMFETDTFTASAAHVRGICEEILRRDIHMTWSCNVRVDMDLTLLPLMKRAGCRMLMVGFEFGSQASLDRVKKGITLEQSRRFAETAVRHGFILHGCFMIGAPGETLISARQTIRFALSLPLHSIQISGLCPYPGTDFYRWAKEAGVLQPKEWRDWVGKNLEQVTLLDYPSFPKSDMDKAIDEGLKRFYFRPRQLLRMLLAIRTSEDLWRNIYGLESFLEYLFSLKR